MSWWSILSSTSPCLCIAIYTLFPCLLSSSHRAVCLLCDFPFSSQMPGLLSSLRMLRVSSAMHSHDSLCSSMCLAPCNPGCLVYLVQLLFSLPWSCNLSNPSLDPVTLFLFVLLVLCQPLLSIKYLSLSQEQVALSVWFIIASWDDRR